MEAKGVEKFRAHDGGRERCWLLYLTAPLLHDFTNVSVMEKWVVDEHVSSLLF